jgi:hypothetical protein
MGDAKREYVCVILLGQELAARHPVDGSTLHSELSFSNPINKTPNEYRANCLHLEGIVYKTIYIYIMSIQFTTVHGK